MLLSYPQDAGGGALESSIAAAHIATSEPNALEQACSTVLGKNREIV
jgi:hypothetical protein